MGYLPTVLPGSGADCGNPGGIREKWGPWWEGTNPTGTTEKEVHGPLRRLCKYPREHFKLHAGLPLQLRRQLDVCSHFQMMLPQRRQTQIHIKPRQSTENTILLGHALMHTLLHALHHCICSKATKSDFEIICYFGLSAPLLATMSMAN